MKIAVIATQPQLTSKAIILSEKLGLKFSEKIKSYPILLALTPERLELRSNSTERFKPIYVDFVAGKLAHRQRYGGGRRQLIARACGLRRLKNPSVVDLTAGLGEDAFVLASLGAQVLMLERSPLIAALLEDGLKRAKQLACFDEFNLQLQHTDSLNYLSETTETPDIVYLDPMFPETKKSALVKKEMRILRQIVGNDQDAAGLLKLAMTTAKNRVVVKRARHAPTLTQLQPDLVFTGKSSRFDVYLQPR